MGVPGVGNKLQIHRRGKRRLGLLAGHGVGQRSALREFVGDLIDKDVLRNKEISFGGLVADIREGITKNGKPYMIIKIEDLISVFVL